MKQDWEESRLKTDFPSWQTQTSCMLDSSLPSELSCPPSTRQPFVLSTHSLPACPAQPSWVPCSIACSFRRPSGRERTLSDRRLQGTVLSPREGSVLCDSTFLSIIISWVMNLTVVQNQSVGRKSVNALFPEPQLLSGNSGRHPGELGIPFSQHLGALTSFSAIFAYVLLTKYGKRERLPQTLL